jgi:hypothetical protein
VLALLASVVMALGCGEGEPPASAVVAAVPTHEVGTRDRVVIANVPQDLLVTVQDMSLFATSADGSFRLYVEHRPNEKLPEVMGGLKDELINLGWEPGDEAHFQNAVSIAMARGPDNHRYRRETWILEAGGRVLVCEAIATQAQLVRLGAPLRELCQRLKITRELVPTAAP